MERHLWLLALVAGGWATVVYALDGAVLPALGLGLLTLVASAISSPWWRGRSARHADVVDLPAADRPVVVYWRPGCTYCARLRRHLGSVGRRARWVNIWQDAGARAFVRSVNDGNETVPTVVIDGEPHTNPAPDLVRQRLEAV
ncbi:glutaredoxin domain-containing protein [Kytococcus sedentarius]|uniref:glutaredoxin domain-containing protein n=1 Tax=Kytococcus sedentarius TaxID=1276 RepID=UPI0035BBE021